MPAAANAAAATVAPPRSRQPPLARAPFGRASAAHGWEPRRPRAVAVAVAVAAAAARRRGLRKYVEAAGEMARRKDGGPPRWFSPLECGAAGGERVPGAPTLLYLPGIDGVGLGLIRHHEKLAKMFELWCLHIPVEDRTSFEGLVDLVEKTVKSESSRASDRPVYLVGESVGACIALAVAVRNPDIDLVLILVNPGTSFHKSQLQTLSAFLDFVPEPFHLTTPQLLTFLTGNFMKMPSTIVGRGFSPEEDNTLSEITSSLLASLMLIF